MKTHKPKIIGVGLQKTGTSSVHVALEILGFRNRHCMPESLTDSFGAVCPPQDQVFDTNIRNRQHILDAYDGFNDLPVPAVDFIDQLLEIYPDAYYVYTNRNVDKWVNSVLYQISKPYVIEQYNARCEKYSDYDPEKDVLYSTNHVGLVEYVYKHPYQKLDAAFLTGYYEMHQQHVYERIRDRGFPFLEMNLGKGDGWEKLCPFLEVRQPPSWFAFPRANSRSHPFVSKVKLRLQREWGKHIYSKTIST